jgi:site-specific DNA recombinase
MTPKTDIKTQDLTFVVQERAIIYCRVSTDEQAESGTSIDNQTEKCLAYAQAQNMQIIATFKEDYTGRVLERPELNKVREMLRRGQADNLIVYKPNRLDRSELGVNLIRLYQELKSLGVSIHYAQDNHRVSLNNPMEEFMYISLAGFQSGVDHRETVIKLREGRFSRVRSGNVMVYSKSPYGYRVVKQGKRTFLEVVEEEAGIIRLIFEWYVYGDKPGQPLSTYHIAKKLDSMGVPSKGDLDPKFKKSRGFGKWGRASVAYILSNETYAGRWYYGKEGRDKSQWVMVNVPEIVSPELFEAAQQKKKQRKNDASRRQKYNYLLSGRIICGYCVKCRLCGETYIESNGHLRSYYFCSSHVGKHKCQLPYFRTDLVDAAVWNWLESFLKDEKVLEKGLRDYQAEQQKNVDPILKQIANIDDLIKQYTEEWDEAYKTLRATKAQRAKAKTAAEIERIEGILDSFESQKKEFEAQIEIKSLTEEQILTIKELGAMMVADLDTIGQDFESKRTLITLLDVQARAVVEDGQRILYVTAKLTPREKRVAVLTNPSKCLIL